MKIKNESYGEEYISFASLKIRAQTYREVMRALEKSGLLATPNIGHIFLHG